MIHAFFYTMVTVQVLGHLKMIDPAQIQSKPLHLCGECPSHHLGQEVDQEILSLTLNITPSLRRQVIFQVRERISWSLPPFMKGWLQSITFGRCRALPIIHYVQMHTSVNNPITSDVCI